MNTGTLYGIGVGPGDPDLLTLKAVKTLHTVDVIYGAASTKNTYSLSLAIAQPHLKDNARVEQLHFPMTRDKQLLEQAWEENAKIVAATLKAGENAAFLTLGDPLIYSTFGYLLRTLQRTEPDLATQIIPGITSYQAAAAKTQTILTESGENLLVLSGVGNAQKRKELLQQADNTVILKAYKNFTDIRQTLTETGLTDNTTFVTRLGLDNERVCRNLEEVEEKPHYFSLLLVKK